MSQNLFDAAIGEVPPSTVDVEAVIARGRRADRRRRLASPALATVAAVAVLLGAVALVAQSDDAGGYAPAGPPSTTRATSPAAPTSEDPCAGMFSTAPPQPEKPAVTEDRLTAVLTDVVSSRLGPGATLERNPIAKNRAGKHLGPLEFYHWFSTPKPISGGCQGGEDYYMGEASVKSADGTGSVSVLVARSGGWAGDASSIQCDEPGVAVDQSDCRTETTAGGDLVMLTGLGKGAAAKGSRTLRVDVVRPDQTYVLVEAANMATSGKYPGPPTASKIPFTHEQLKQIALDPRVTMYPK